MVIIGAIALSTLFSGGPSYTKVNTSDIAAQLNSGNVQKVLIEDKEQTIDLDLKQKPTFDNTSTDKIQAQVPAGAVDDFYKDAHGRQGRWQDQRSDRHQGDQGQRPARACWSTCCRSRYW